MPHDSYGLVFSTQLLDQKFADMFVETSSHYPSNRLSFCFVLVLSFCSDRLGHSQGHASEIQTLGWLLLLSPASLL